MWLEYFVKNWFTKSRHSVTPKIITCYDTGKFKVSFTPCKTQKLLEIRKYKENRLKWYR